METMWERGQREIRENLLKQRELQALKEFSKHKRMELLEEHQRELIERRRKQDLERNAHIVELHLGEGKTFREIAEVEGVSTNSIRSRFVRLHRLYGLEYRRYAKVKKPDIETKCGFGPCAVVLKFRPSFFKDHGRHFCKEHQSATHKNSWLTKNPNWGKMSVVERQRWKYHHSPEWRRLNRIRTKRWLEKIKQDPEKLQRLRERQRAISARWRERQKQKRHEEVSHGA